jgi:hypothetical protein
VTDRGNDFVESSEVPNGGLHFNADGSACKEFVFKPTLRLVDGVIAQVT